MLSPRYVDSRESPERKKPLILAGFAPKQLAAGDVQFPAAGGQIVLLELKKMYQFLDDMQSGQLSKQARNLAYESDHPWLILEGQLNAKDGRLLDAPSMTVEQVKNYLATLQDMGIRWERTEDNRETVRRVIELAFYYSKDTHSSAHRVLAGDVRVNVLCHIPGIGPEKAKTLLTRFRTLAGVAGATIPELETADNIGPKLAQRIWAFWQEH